MDQCSDGFLPVSRLRKRTGTDTDVCGSKDGGSGGGCGELRRDGRERAERGLPAQGSVRILASVTGGKDEEEMKLFEKALSDATGLTVTIEKPASDYDKILMQKLSGGEKYDLIYLNAPQY